jgi:hypothetical protein
MAVEPGGSWVVSLEHLSSRLTATSECTVGLEMGRAGHQVFSCELRDLVAGFNFRSSSL